MANVDVRQEDVVLVAAVLLLHELPEQWAGSRHNHPGRLVQCIAMMTESNTLKVEAPVSIEGDAVAVQGQVGRVAGRGLENRNICSSIDKAGLPGRC